VLSVALVTDVQTFIGSGMPAVLAIGFGAIMLLRRRDRRRRHSDSDQAGPAVDPDAQAESFEPEALEPQVIDEGLPGAQAATGREPVPTNRSRGCGRPK
jgi:hypothetical protein